MTNSNRLCQVWLLFVKLVDEGVLKYVDAANNWIRFYDNYKEVAKSIRKGKTRRKEKEAEKDEELYKSFDFIAEEIELIELLKEIDRSINETKFLKNAKGMKEKLSLLYNGFNQ